MTKMGFIAVFLLSGNIFAGSDLSSAELLLKEAKINDVQMVRTKKYLAVIEDVTKAEAGQKGKSILTEENIVAIFHKYGKSEMQLNILNGILAEYAKTVRSGKAADEQTLYLAAENFKKAKYPFIPKATFFSYYEEVLPLLRTGTAVERQVAQAKTS